MDEKRKVTQEEIDNACILHNKYIEGEDGGKQAVFENCSFERLSFKDKQFNSAVFRKCEFNLCDLTDTGMCFSELHNVRFNGCNCYMLTAEEAAIRDVTFDKCDLRSAVFTHSSLRNIAFEKGNAYADTTIIVPITSRMKNDIPNHVIIHYGILKKYIGCVLTEQVRTISIYRLKKYLGTLNEKDIRKIDKALKISLEVHKHEVK